MNGMAGLALIFVVVCAVTAFVCTAVKEDEDAHLFRNAARLFGVMFAGIAGFGVVVQLVTWLAGR